ncbi:MAG: hypothetical protein LAO21_19445 [Acidobacteriia bacterium]|nr:hypothetical protein [Terriglobia bacterium]
MSRPAVFQAQQAVYGWNRNTQSRTFKVTLRLLPTLNRHNGFGGVRLPDASRASGEHVEGKKEGMLFPAF